MQMKLSWKTSIVLFVHNLDTWELETGESGVQVLFLPTQGICEQPELQ